MSSVTEAHDPRRGAALRLRLPAERVTLVGCGEGGPEVPRLAWPVLVWPSWRAECSSSSQLDEAAFGNDRGGPELPGLRRRTAWTQAAANGGIVDDRDLRAEQHLAHVSAKLVPRANAAAENGADQVAGEAAGNAVLEHHRYLAGGHLRGPSRRTARSPATRPISPGCLRLFNEAPNANHGSRSMAVPVPAIEAEMP